MVRLRPTFSIELEPSRQDVIDKLTAACEQLRQKQSFCMFGEYGELHVPVEQHRLWSPHLSFYVSTRGDASLIRGRFAPRLEVWTFVWIVYLAMSFSVFYGLALAYSQWMLGETAWGWWIAAGGLLVIVSLYLCASIGQQWSSDQMTDLRRRLEGVLQSAGIDCVQPTLAHASERAVAV